MSSEIVCKNCSITIKTIENKNKDIATVKWSNGDKEIFENTYNRFGVSSNTFIISHPTKGFYYLNNDKILHISEKGKSECVLFDKSLDWNWFGSFSTDSIIYFPKYNVLILSRLDGDHDYIWCWCLNEYYQEANIDKPYFYNGCFNIYIDIEQIDDRYAKITEDDHENYGDSDDTPDSDDSDDLDSEGIKTVIMIDAKQIAKTNKK